MNRISDSMFHSRSTACKKPYGAVPAGQAVEFSVYPQRAQGALQVTLWIEEDGCQAESIRCTGAAIKARMIGIR